VANVAAKLTESWNSESARIHFVREFYDPGWEATEQYTERELGIAESRHDGYHDDIWVTAMMMVTDPEQVRYRQRIEASLASINGIAIDSLDEAVQLGRKMIEFRAEFTADAIRDVVSN
jgi:creatinine amidohydrolase